MKFLRTFASVAFVGLATAGCSDSTDAELTIADLAGTWEATTFRVTLDADPSVVFDLIAIGGSSEVVITAAGAYTETRTLPGVGDVPDVGTFTLDSQTQVTRTSTTSGDADTFEFTLVGETMTLTGAGEFPAPPVLGAPASVNVVYVRQ